MFSWLSHNLLQRALLLLVIALCLVYTMVPASYAMVPIGSDEQTAILSDAFPSATKISDKVPFAHKQPEMRTIYQDDEIIGYAFETVDVVDVAAYSGKPVNLLVALDTKGEIKVVRVLDHDEPILLIGIPEQRLFDFASQLVGMDVRDHVIVGRSGIKNAHSIDSISGATVTVMVVNEVVMRSARKVAGLLGIGGLADKATGQTATINQEVFSEADWRQLTGDGSIRRLQLNYVDIDQAFEGTKAAFKGKGNATAREKNFIDLYYTLLDIPTVGRSLLGDDQYSWLISELKPGDHAIAVFGKGDYSFKGTGYVRGGIFDRIQLQQAGKSIMFRDSDFYRLSDVYLPDMPDFSEMAIFIIRDSYQFDIGKNWQLELLVRRQVGALDGVFARFSSDYSIPEKYLERPPVTISEAGEQALWVSVWRNKAFQITVLSISLLLLFTVIVMQDVLVKYPRFLRIFRLSFLVYTLFFIGWYTMGQLSIVNVFTFVHSMMSGFKWDTFLLDPIMFILWGFVAVTLLLWGRGIFCGWLCPFGALQELISEIARKLRVRQIELPFAVHERLWAVKYLILLVLFAISLESMSEAERYAEVEPFKTAITLKFQREWAYVLYAAVLLIVSAFTHKAYCRYLCPLGAALAIPSRFRLFDWLKRRKECGTQCQICANECEIQAIHPSGKINANECHWCLDCQVTYHNESKCPPLIKQYNKRHKMEKGFIPITIVEEEK
ncbi:MAG: 4Fe-4S binding protein [Methylophaga sp.]|nr:4Fe-4S binding protein [Methylophaga sp.]